MATSEEKHEGVTAEPAGILNRHTADGTYEWGGALGGVLIIDLTFPSGEKRHFAGEFVGDVGGGASGVCHYAGQVIPKPGDEWKFSIIAEDLGVGYAKIVFNPVAGPHARVTGVSAGGGVAGAGGKGTWTEG